MDPHPTRPHAAALVVLGAIALGGCSDTARPTDPIAPTLSQAPTAEGCLTDVSDCPPQAWVDDPTVLPAGITVDNSSCTLFPFPPTITWDLHPTAGCQQKEWGASGIYRQQARDLHVGSLRACAGTQGDIDEIRLCSSAWVNRSTPFGPAGGAGCVVTWIEVTCGV
jgi:hypothetical protein